MATMSILGLFRWKNDILGPLLMQVPDMVDQAALQGEILAQCAEFEILYPDPDVFVEILRYWVAGQLPVWERIAKAIQTEYNIAENYDRSEEWTDTGSGTSNNKNYYKGYPVTSDMVNQSSNDGSSTANSTHVGRVHGNIGVRSAQELVEQEFALAEKINLQQRIVDDFKNRFCLPVY